MFDDMFESYMKEMLVGQLDKVLEMAGQALVEAASRIPPNKRVLVVRGALLIGSIGRELAARWNIPLVEPSSEDEPTTDYSDE